MRPRVSLEQWRALVAVVEAGSYAGAAGVLNKSQSTVSHAVQRLEEQLGLAVFRTEGRRAVLTQAGEVLYRRGRALVAEAGRLEETAARLGAGAEPVIGLGAEVLFPTWLLLDCLRDFGDAFPDTRVELYETVLGGGEEALREGLVDLAVCSRVPSGFVADPLMAVRLRAVAAPDHPLHQLGRNLTAADLQGYRHLFIRDSGTQRERAAGWQVAEQRWTVSHKATAIRALCLGLGFAWVADGIIREELASGALRPLPLLQGGERWTTLYLAHADPDGPGPGARWLADRLRWAAGTAASTG
ncbi:MAG: LysR family transcriptional regulator [Ectothiorhodospiraceae bacterium]